MHHALLAALLVASATATAQTQENTGGPPTTAQPPAGERLLDSPELQERIRREVEERVKAAEEQMREELRAQLATQSLTSDWKEEEWVEQKRKLELFTLDGYFRLRPSLFHQMDLGKVTSPFLFPRSPRPTENTQSGATMRLRLEPTLNVSEEVRVRMQIDALDNVLLGSSPDAASPDDSFHLFDLFSDTQLPPNSAVNALRDSVQFKRIYGEVTTPIGLLRFGRMGAHWGLGIFRNAGECLDCDFGDNADRIMLVTEPLEGLYVTPILEFNSEGPNTGDIYFQREPIDLSNADDATSLSLVVARRDTEQQIKAKLDNGQGVLNYGLFFTYRTQRFSAVNYDPGSEQLNTTPPLPRDATLFIPDVWARYEEKLFKLELELVAVLGRMGNRGLTATEAALGQELTVAQFGGALQGEYRFLNGQLKLQGEVGFASGDRAPGMGAFPRRGGTREDGATAPGDLEGPQYRCDVTGCGDSAIRNYRFNRAYRVDTILWRELLGTVTDAWYVKPTLSYSLAAGLDLYGSAIYSQAFYAESTPSTTDRSLGVELNVGARYETEDGFTAGVVWAILFPLGGLQELNEQLRRELQSAQVVRGMLGIRF
jgi:uncharacterized protein (TIGR04551 family)